MHNEGLNMTVLALIFLEKKQIIHQIPTAMAFAENF